MSTGKAVAVGILAGAVAETLLGTHRNPQPSHRERAGKALERLELIQEILTESAGSFEIGLLGELREAEKDLRRISEDVVAPGYAKAALTAMKIRRAAGSLRGRARHEREPAPRAVYSVLARRLEHLEKELQNLHH